MESDDSAPLHLVVRKPPTHTVGNPASDLVPGQGVTNGYAIFVCASSSVPVSLAGAHTNVRAGSTV